MVKLNSHRNHMIIASSMHPVLGELRTLFLEGVTRSCKITWSSVKINWGTNNRGKTSPTITSEIPFQVGEIQASGIMLFASSEPGLSHRDADIKLKTEQTSLAPFDDHMAGAHGSHVSVTQRHRHSCKGNFTNFCCKEIQQST